MAVKKTPKKKVAKKKQPSKKVGRPEIKLTKEIIEIICREIANGGTLLGVSKRDDMPSRWSIYKWLALGDQDFRDQKKSIYSEFSYNHARACEAQTEYEVDEIKHLVDEIPEGAWFEDVNGEKYSLSQVQKTNKIREEEGEKPLEVELKGVTNELLKKRQMQINVRQWGASKKMPKKYGDKVDMTLAGDAERPLTTVDHKELVKSLGKEESKSLLDKMRGAVK